MVILKCMAMIGIAIFSMLFSLANDIKCDLNIINLCSKIKRKRSKMVKKLPQFLQFHSDTLQLSCNSFSTKFILNFGIPKQKVLFYLSDWFVIFQNCWKLYLPSYFHTSLREFAVYCY